MFFRALHVFILRGFGAFAALLLTLLVSNVVDTNEAGLFMYSIGVIVLIGSLITCGAPNVLLKTIGANNEGDWLIINNNFSGVIKLSLTVGIGVIFLLQLNPLTVENILGVKGLNKVIPIIGFGILIFAYIELFVHALLGMHKTLLASTVQNVVTPALFVSVVMISHTLEYILSCFSLIIIYVCSSFVALFIGFFSWFRLKKARFKINSKLNLKFKESMTALFTMVIMIQCVQWSGQLAAGKYLSTNDIAFFASAQRTALLASFVLIAVNLVVAPKFARAFAKGDYNDVNSLSLLSSRLMVAMALPVLLFMFMFPEFLMSLFGEEYVIAAPLLQIMAVGQFINVITGSVGYLLNMTGHEKDMRNVVLFSGPLAIVLAFVLTKEFGLIGAAYATAISLATQNLLAAVMVKKRLGFNTLNIFRKIA